PVFFSRPWMAGMPKMQEHFSASTRMARHTGNAGTFFGRHGWRPLSAIRGLRGPLTVVPTFAALGLLPSALELLPGGHAENAGAILGRCLDGRHAEERRSFLRR